MPPKPENRGISVTMSQEEKAIVDKIAKDQGFKSTAEYVRFLIEQHSENIGQPMKFGMQWGGHRGRSAKPDDE